MHYKLRVDYKSDDTYDTLMSLIEKYFDIYAWCFEDGDNNPHFHVYGLMTKFKEGALRTALRSFNSRGDYSLAQLKEVPGQWEDGYPIRYIAYMYKEGEVSARGFTEAYLDKARELSQKLTDQSTKKKKSAQKEVVYALLTKHLEANPERYANQDLFDVFNVYRFLLIELPKQEIPIRRSSLTYWIDEFFCKLGYGPYIRRLADELSDRHFTKPRN